LQLTNDFIFKMKVKLSDICVELQPFFTSNTNKNHQLQCITTYFTQTFAPGPTNRIFYVSIRDVKKYVSLCIQHDCIGHFKPFFDNIPFVYNEEDTQDETNVVTRSSTVLPVVLCAFISYVCMHIHDTDRAINLLTQFVQTILTVKKSLYHELHSELKCHMHLASTNILIHDRDDLLLLVDNKIQLNAPDMPPLGKLLFTCEPLTEDLDFILRITRKTNVKVLGDAFVPYDCPRCVEKFTPTHINRLQSILVFMTACSFKTVRLIWKRFFVDTVVTHSEELDSLIVKKLNYIHYIGNNKSNHNTFETILQYTPYDEFQKTYEPILLYMCQRYSYKRVATWLGEASQQIQSHRKTPTLYAFAEYFQLSWDEPLWRNLFLPHRDILHIHPSSLFFHQITTMNQVIQHNRNAVHKYANVCTDLQHIICEYI